MSVQKLVEYAASKGHRRIAFIHGHNNSVVTRTRISQFRNTMAYHGLPVPEDTEYLDELMPWGERYARYAAADRDRRRDEFVEFARLVAEAAA